MQQRTIYLDHNATTPVLPDVVNAMLPFLSTHFGNPSSTHGYGRVAREAIDKARAQVAGLLGARTSEVVFTASGTEASNLAIRGLQTDRRHVVTSAVEHPATARAVAVLGKQGWRVDVAPVDGEGRLTRIADFLRADTGLLSVMLANNETGAILPVADLASEAKAVGAFVHVDAAQAVGKIDVDVDALGADLLSLAGHKLYAPKGIGALYVRSGTPLAPLVVGGGHERGLRPGTENVPYIVGLGVAAELAARTLAVESARQTELRDRLWRRLAAAVPGLALNGPALERLPNTLNVSFPGRLGAEVLASAPEIAASTGSACHEGQHEPSAVLMAMGLPADRALGAVRLSIGRSTTAEQVDGAAAALARAWREAA